MIRRAAVPGACRVLLAALVALGFAARTRADEPVPITVQLDWKPGVQFAGLLVAQERGWYRDAVLAVTIRANDFRRPYVDVVAGSDDTVGTSEAHTLVNARVRGRPIRAVATMFQASPVVLISLKARGLRTVADLAGKTVGVHRPQDGDALREVFGELPLALRRVGFDFKELLAGEVDAAPGYAMDEPLRLAQNGTEVNVLPLAEHGRVDYAQVFFVSQAFLAKNPAALERFLVATFRGWRAALADPDATAEFIGRQYPTDLNPASLRESLRLMAPLLTKESPHLGTMKLETWKHIVAWTPGDEQAVRPAKVEDLVDFRFMPTLEKD